ncbi:MAG: hypothetical protein GKC04_00230 [Methanomicrobiales archaeon]|nr:hypothetical protein [Methanomicrobiales archaeon]
METKEMLDAYIGRMGPLADTLDADDAHEIAQVFLAYKFGLWEHVIRLCTRLLPETGNGDLHEIIRAALRIVLASATARRMSSPTVPDSYSFDSSAEPFLVLPRTRDSAGYEPAYQLDMALLLLYAAAYRASPPDREALAEQEEGIIIIIDTYRPESEKNVKA